MILAEHTVTYKEEESSKIVLLQLISGITNKGRKKKTYIY